MFDDTKQGIDVTSKEDAAQKCCKQPEKMCEDFPNACKGTSKPFFDQSKNKHRVADEAEAKEKCCEGKTCKDFKTERPCSAPTPEFDNSKCNGVLRIRITK